MCDTWLKDLADLVDHLHSLQIGVNGSALSAITEAESVVAAVSAVPQIFITSIEINRTTGLLIA